MNERAIIRMVHRRIASLRKRGELGPSMAAHPFAWQHNREATERVAELRKMGEIPVEEES